MNSQTNMLKAASCHVYYRYLCVNESTSNYKRPLKNKVPDFKTYPPKLQSCPFSTTYTPSFILILQFHPPSGWLWVSSSHWPLLLSPNSFSPLTYETKAEKRTNQEKLREIKIKGGMTLRQTSVGAKGDCKDAS